MGRGGRRARALRPAFLVACDALRDFVRCVDATAHPMVPHSEATARYLFAPFAQLLSDFANRPAPRAPRPAPTPGSSGRRSERP